MTTQTLVSIIAIFLGGLIGFTVFFVWLFSKTKKKKHIITAIIGLAVFLITAAVVNFWLLPLLPEQ